METTETPLVVNASPVVTQKVAMQSAYAKPLNKRANPHAFGLDVRRSLLQCLATTQNAASAYAIRL
jgi:hypothetical protein